MSWVLAAAAVVFGGLGYWLWWRFFGPVTTTSADWKEHFRLTPTGFLHLATMPPAERWRGEGKGFCRWVLGNEARSIAARKMAEARS